MTTMTMTNRPTTFFKRFVPLFGAGLLGFGALVAANAQATIEQMSKVPGLADLPAPALLALSAVQPAVITGVMAALGAAIAPRLGLRSYIADKFAEGLPIWPRLKPELPLAMAMGAASGVFITVADLATKRFLPPVKESGAQLAEVLSHTNLPSILASLLYGGVTEEIWMRWGLMSLFAFVGLWLAQRGQGRPGPVVMWSAITLASLLFGVGHLPVTSILYGLTPFVIGRALVLNGVFGLIAGWLYWRRSLEAAMAAHAMGHVVLTVVNLTAAALAG